MTREIEGGEVGFEFVLQIDRLLFDDEARDVFFIEAIAKLGLIETAFGLRDEVIDLARGDASDVILDGGDAARFDRELAFAVERENAAAALDFDFARQLGNVDHVLVGGTERKTTGRLHAFIDANEELAVVLDRKLESMRRRLLVLRWNERELDRLRALQHFVVNLRWTAPAFCSRTLFLVVGHVLGMLLTTRFCLFLRQQKHVQRFLNILRFRRGRRVDDQHLLRLAVIIAHDLPLRFADLEEAGDIRHSHLGL